MHRRLAFKSAQNNKMPFPVPMATHLQRDLVHTPRTVVHTISLTVQCCTVQLCRTDQYALATMEMGQPVYPSVEQSRRYKVLPRRPLVCDTRKGSTSCLSDLALRSQLKETKKGHLKSCTFSRHNLSGLTKLCLCLYQRIGSRWICLIRDHTTPRAHHHSGSYECFWRSTRRWQSAPGRLTPDTSLMWRNLSWT